MFSHDRIRGSVLRGPDSSDEDDATLEDTLVTEFDQINVQQKGKASESRIVIPSLSNPDWREAARRRRAAAHGSARALGTTDTLNSGPQLSGLQIKKRVKTEVNGDSVGEADVFPDPPLTETDALRQDVAVLPDCATAEDYARVPVSDFGAAMLRGMGWTEGTVASKSEKSKMHGLIEPYLPQARPALLGIGAKESNIEGDGSGKRKKPWDKRYVPVVRRDGGEESGSSRSGTRSRRTSRSPSARTGDESGLSKSRHHSRDRDQERRRRDDSRRERHGEYRRRDR